MTRHAVGDMSMPIHWRSSFCAATSAVPQPQKASSTMSFSLLLALMMRSSSGQRLLRRIAKTLFACELTGWMSSQTSADGHALAFVEVALLAWASPVWAE